MHYFVKVCIRGYIFELYMYYCEVYRYTTITVLWNILMQCGNHICSVIHVKYVCNAHCHMVDDSDFICGAYMCIHLPYKSIKYLAYMPSLVGKYVSSTYLAIT